MDEHINKISEVCKFAAGYVPSPLHCGCSKCCPALATAERRLKTISAVEKVKNLKKAFAENDIPWPRISNYEN